MVPTPRRIRSHRCSNLVLSIGLLSSLWLNPTASAAEFSAAEIAFFETKVRPILVEHCYKCHGKGDSIKGGLRLTHRRGLVDGGDSGPAFAATSPDTSLLLAAVNYSNYEMPPSGKLPGAKIDLLTKWIRMGAPWPDEETEADASNGESGPPSVNDEAKRFWSFQKVKETSLPAVESSWAETPIDTFISHQLEAAEMTPAAPAAKSELLRRAYYDLTGLPPSPDEVAAFLADESSTAFETIIDRLLDSPQYGERWARHWLDLVRYAESNSYERDDPKPFVWRYRDYVIRAFNEDKPYTDFVLEQLAGDEIAAGNSEPLIATGYYRLGPWQDEPVDVEQELFEDLDDLVRTTGEVFLGLTIGCARCHDHKLDPIPQRDYYRFLAFFRNVRRFGERSPDSVADASLISIGSPQQQQRYEKEVRAHQQELQQNRQQLAELDRRIQSDLVGVERDDWKTEAARIEIAKKRIGSILTQEEFESYVTLTRRRGELRKFKPPGLDQALCVKEHGREAPATYVLVRGNAHVQGEPVEPGFPSVLSPPVPVVELPAEGVPTTGRRLALAKWIANAENPLTARVIVNRIWQHHFGRGIVRSSSDFGFQGVSPTHPDLLDWLARDFVSGGWRIKRMHKQIMLSKTYQMSSRADTDALSSDPTNNLQWRFNMRRLSAEEIRDSILAVNNRLNRSLSFGPSFYPEIPQQVLAGQSRPGAGWGKSTPDERARRSIYIHSKRSLAVPLLANFDGPETDASCPVRFSTTQPTQSLTMLNSQFIQEQSEHFAQYLRRTAGEDRERQVQLALRRILQRVALPHEIKRGANLLAVLQHRYGLSADDSLTHFCVTMFNMNEFMYVD